MANSSFAQEKEVRDINTKKEEKVSQKKENKQDEKLKEKTDDKKDKDEKNKKDEKSEKNIKEKKIDKKDEKETKKVDKKNEEKNIKKETDATKEKDVKEKKVNQKKEDKQNEKKEKLDEKDKDLHKEKEEDLQQNEAKKEEKIVKDFKLKDYEHKDFNVKVFSKGEHKYLEYTHKKTKAKVVFSLFNNQKDYDEDVSEPVNILFRYDPSKYKDAWEIAHCLEHLLCVEKEGERNTDKINNAVTTFNSISFYSNKIIPSLDFLENLLKIFKDPPCFKDNKKLFRQEVFDRVKVGDKKFDVGRVFFELLSTSGTDISRHNPFFYDIIDNKRKWNDDVENVRKMTIEKIKEFYKKFIHPSNSLTLINSLMNPLEVQKMLDVIANWNKGYSYRKYEEKNFYENYYKSKQPLEDMKLYSDSKLTTVYKKFGKEKKCKYKAEVHIDVKKLVPNLNAEKMEVLAVSHFFIEKFLGKDYAEKLGYENVYVSYNANLGQGFFIAVSFLGDDKEKFKETEIVKSAKKILKDLYLKFKTIPEKRMLEESVFYKSPKKSALKKFLERVKKDCHYRGGNLLQSDFLKNNFFYTGEPFNNLFLDLKKDKILDGVERANKIIYNNLNGFEYLYKDGAEKHYMIDRFTLSNKEGSLKGKKIRTSKTSYIPPIELDKKHKDFVLKNVAKDVFVKKFLERYLRKLKYCPFEKEYPNAPHICVSYGVNNHVREIFDEYFKKEFSKDLKNYKLEKKDFDEYLNYIISKFEQEQKELKRILKEFKKFKKENPKLITGKRKVLDIKDVNEIYFWCLIMSKFYVEGCLSFKKWEKGVAIEKKYNKIFKEIDELFKKYHKNEDLEYSNVTKKQDAILKKIYEKETPLFEDLSKKFSKSIKKIKKYQDEFIRRYNGEEKDESKKITLENVMKIIKSIKLRKKKFDVKKVLRLKKDQ